MRLVILLRSEGELRGWYNAVETGLTRVQIHGWPDLSMGWRYQIPLLVEMGFRVVAPDMMGYGGTVSVFLLVLRSLCTRLPIDHGEDHFDFVSKLNCWNRMPLESHPTRSIYMVSNRPQMISQH